MPIRKSPIPSKTLSKTSRSTSSNFPIGCKSKHVRLNSGKVFDLVLIPTVGSEEELSWAAYLSSIADTSETSKAICYSTLIEESNSIQFPKYFEFISPVNQNDSMSGVNLRDRMIRKGPIESIEDWIGKTGGTIHNQTRRIVDQILRRGHQAIVVADHDHDLGVIELIF